jgi:hypothetical protein
MIFVRKDVIGKSIVACLLFFSNFANAESNSPVYQTRRILPACQTAITSHNDNSQILAFHEGLCLGLISTALRAGAAMNHQFKFCPPTNLDPKTFIPILSTFVEQNFNALDVDIRDLVNYVARINYPCR